MKIDLAILFGGASVEHEISIITALQAIENINRDRYNIIPVYITKDGEFLSDDMLLDIENFRDMSKLGKLKPVTFKKDNNKFYIFPKHPNLFNNKAIAKIDLAFPIVHGTNVEDGKLQGYLETIGMTVIGTNTTSGVVGQDKIIMKDILTANNILQTNYMWFLESDDLENSISQIIDKLGNDVIIKPAELGSSIGISVAHGEQEIKNALELAYTFSSKVVVEELLTDFTEVNISVCGNHKSCVVSVTEQVSKNDEILSYEDKYLSNAKKTSKSSGMASLSRIIPANLDQEINEQIKSIAAQTFRYLHCSGVIRIDLMIVGNKIYVNEINNIPGSLAFYLWEASGTSYQELLDMVIEAGIDSYYEKQKHTFSIDTNVLQMSGGKK